MSATSFNNSELLSEIRGEPYVVYKPSKSSLVTRKVGRNKIAELLNRCLTESEQEPLKRQRTQEGPGTGAAHTKAPCMNLVIFHRQENKREKKGRTKRKAVGTALNNALGKSPSYDSSGPRSETNRKPEPKGSLGSHPRIWIPKPHPYLFPGPGTVLITLCYQNSRPKAYYKRGSHESLPAHDLIEDE